jgi:ribosomal protein S18 acetylase RimI-like enzyme
LRYYRTIRLDERNGIAKRTPEYIQKKWKVKMLLSPRQWLLWFCYIESWQESNYVAHSGLIVHPDYRNLGLAKKNQIKSF